jgi:hypothetical protein
MGKSKTFVDLSQETRDMWRPEDVMNISGQLCDISLSVPNSMVE